jgi:phytol kinase
MAFNFKNEILRKLVHLTSLSFLVIYIIFEHLLSHRAALFALSVLLVILIEFEYFRVELGKKIPVVSLIWKYVMRDHEKNRLGAHVFFLMATIICLAAFDFGIAVAAVLMTTFGDMAAALIGKKYGKHWIKCLKKKAWEGVIAELVVNIIIGAIILRAGISGQPIWSIVIVMSVTATFVETIISKLDDNLLVPVFSGFAGQVALMILNYLGRV